MTKNLSRDQALNGPSEKRLRKPGRDGVRLATFGGVLALLVISLWNWRSINRIQSGLDSRLGRIESRLSQVSGKVDTVAAQIQPPRRGPDPNRVYTINTLGAPAKGPIGAPVTIAEFSDFQ